MNRKMRIYPPVIVTMLVALALMAAAVATISTETEQMSAATRLPITASNTLVQTVSEIIPAATSEPEPIPQSSVRSLDLDDKDVEMLLKIAMAEAEGESVEGKALVMLVVLNRAQDDRFPDSIQEVIFQKNQFSPVVEGGRYWTTEPDAGCYEALELVMDGWDESQGALYFESTGKDGWHSRNLEFLFELGCHKFYR